jgi:lysozyme
MNLSKSGLDRIAGYEGYHDALPDGSCKAYQRTYNGKKDKWTIGFGCTSGVYEGLVWTRAQADDAFRKELATFEAAVNRMVTVDLNQNQYDALVSFAYNCGTGALQSSTLLKKLNKGDYKGAAAQFQYWNNVNHKPVKGLTQRRTSEANLFLKPVEAETLPAMPQTVEKAPEPPSRKSVAAAVAAAGAGVAQIMPADPLGTAEGLLSTGTRIRGVSQNSHELGTWALSLPHWPYVIGACVLGGGLYWALCHYLPKKQGDPE